MINLENLVNECAAELQSCGLEYSGYPITWAYRKNKSNWAVTKYRVNKCTGETFDFHIEINPVLKEATNIHEIKDTIIHEMLHTFPNCDGHKGEWKRLANIVNRNLGYSIERTGDYQDFGFSENPMASRPNYRFICDCGRKREFIRRCGTMNLYLDGVIKCSKCGSTFTGYKIAYKK